jgi:hypothetical protein
VVLDDLEAERVVEEPVEAALDADREQQLVGLERLLCSRRASRPSSGAMVALTPLPLVSTAVSVCPSSKLKPFFL